MQAVPPQSGSLLRELKALVRELKMEHEPAFAASSGRTAPVLLVQVIDEVGYAEGLKEADQAANSIGPASLGVLNIINIANREIEEARKLRSADSQAGRPFGCDELISHRRHAEHFLRQAFGDVARLYCAAQRTLGNIQFIHVCPPHPCDDPSFPGDGRHPGGGYHGADTAYAGSGAYDAGGELKTAHEARAAAERAARDAEAEWKVQSERAAELEVQGRQEKEARWAAERTLRETEARARQAEQGRSDAERLAEETKASRQAAEARSAELEERLRQREREQTEPQGGAETQPTKRTSSAKRRSPGRKRRGAGAES